MKGPGLAEFLFRAQAVALYRKLVKTAYKIEDVRTRNETIEFYKGEFRKLTTVEESKARFSYLRGSVGSLAEMINRSGCSRR